MREAVNSVYQILLNDEELLRLLWYYPLSAKNPDPLDKTLPNVLDMETVWDIRDERILLMDKTSDIEEKPICRICITAGRRRPKANSYVVAEQEINISIFSHESYEYDMRNSRISDRINSLLVNEQMDGMIGKFRYVSGNPRVAPKQYTQYVHTYVYGDGVK